MIAFSHSGIAHSYVCIHIFIMYVRGYYKYEVDQPWWWWWWWCIFYFYFFTGYGNTQNKIMRKRKRNDMIRAIVPSFIAIFSLFKKCEKKHKSDKIDLCSASLNSLCMHDCNFKAKEMKKEKKTKTEMFAYHSSYQSKCTMQNECGFISETLTDWVCAFSKSSLLIFLLFLFEDLFENFSSCESNLINGCFMFTYKIPFWVNLKHRCISKRANKIVKQWKSVEASSKTLFFLLFRALFTFTNIFQLLCLEYLLLDTWVCV